MNWSETAETFAIAGAWILADILGEYRFKFVLTVMKRLSIPATQLRKRE